MSTETLNLETFLPCPFCRGKITRSGNCDFFCGKCHAHVSFSHCSLTSHAARLMNVRPVTQGEIWDVADLKALREKMIQAYRMAKEDQPYVASARIDAIIEEIRPYLREPKRKVEVCEHGYPIFSGCSKCAQPATKREIRNRMTAQEGEEIIHRATQHGSIIARYPQKAFSALEKVADIFKKTEIEDGGPHGN